jgi:sortase A
MIDRDPPRKRTRRLELILLLAGTIGTGAWLASDAIRILAMGWDSWVLRRNSGSEAVTSARSDQPPTLANNDLIGRLAIPRLRLVTTVREGTGHRTLAIASGHIRGTTLPGQNGNVGVAGHRDTFFRGLAGVRVNDEIEFETAV